MSEKLVEEKFEKAQQELVDKFKSRLKSVCEDVLHDIYTDVSNYATTDAHINYHNYLKDEFRASLLKEISSEHGQWSWAHSIRMELLEKHKDILQTKIISDLQERVKTLEEMNQQLHDRRYSF